MDCRESGLGGHFSAWNRRPLILEFTSTGRLIRRRILLSGKQ